MMLLLFIGLWTGMVLFPAILSDRTNRRLGFHAFRNGNGSSVERPKYIESLMPRRGIEPLRA